MENTFKSLFGAESEINIAQYIAELVVSRQAKWRKVSLPDRFWKDPTFIQWTKTFRIQKMRVEALRKAGYEYSTILRALNSTQGQYIASLHNKKLDYLLEEEQRKVDAEKTVVENSAKPLEISGTEQAPVVFTKKNDKFSKLRD